MDETAAPSVPVKVETVLAEAPPSVAPVADAERLVVVDVMRGVAVLGILLMNIVGFAFHSAAYLDPTVAGGATGINLWVYSVNEVLVDGKMRGIFSFLFGAGVVILTTRFERRGSADGADVHYRRMFWLMLFGAVHAYFLWWGDILYPYALVGLLLFPMRRLSVRGLAIAGVVFSVLISLAMIGAPYRAISLRDEAAKADSALAAGQQLTEEQVEAQRAWREYLKGVKPDAAEIARVNQAFGGSFVDALKERAKLVAQFHFTPYYFPLYWDMLCMMLLGMAMAKSGALSGDRPSGYYRRMAAIGYAVGLPLAVWWVWRNIAVDFDHIPMAFNNIAYEPSRILISFGHIAVIILIVKAGVLRGLTDRLAAVGQMAFTNYILQSVTGATIFYGYGFGLFGKLERYQVYYVVLGCWLFALIASPMWLRHFRFGPLEWCWRSLTYWKRQPMRIRRENRNGSDVLERHQPRSDRYDTVESREYSQHAVKAEVIEEETAARGE
jgi:uncharacterized protein